MKKSVVSMTAAILAALMLSACSGGETDKKNDSPASTTAAAVRTETEAPKDTEATKTTGSVTEKAEEFDIESYKKPADVVSLDLTKDDPTADGVRFVFDDNGRVTNCYYKLGENEVALVYKYDDGSAEIYAFVGSTLVADDKIELSDFDAEKGFSEIDGYYFKGFEAK